MANQLDELNPEIREEGLDTNVIAKKLPAEVGFGSKLFEIILWVCGIIPGLIFLFMKISAQKHFDQLQQKIQRNASQIDNYLEQRVMVLQNCARLLDKAIDLDKSTFENIAKYRSGNANNADGDNARNEISGQIENISRDINVAVENYPDLKAHREIADAMQQNMYLQREITAARELYNDTINEWNKDIFAWPTKKIVAAKNGYTTRIPFIASKEIKEQAKSVFF
ncbi:MAG: LemA family protein [Clostridia bacterium]|nr:LemA family protein [Clostridia bacterium]